MFILFLNEGSETHVTDFEKIANLPKYQASISKLRWYEKHTNASYFMMKRSIDTPLSGCFQRHWHSSHRKLKRPQATAAYYRCRQFFSNHSSSTYRGKEVSGRPSWWAWPPVGGCHLFMGKPAIWNSSITYRSRRATQSNVIVLLLHRPISSGCGSHTCHQCKRAVDVPKDRPSTVFTKYSTGIFHGTDRNRRVIRKAASKVLDQILCSDTDCEPLP